MVSNSDVELEIARNISETLRRLKVLPEGYRCDVHLLLPTKSKKHRDADFERNWDPDKDSIRIAFSPVDENAETMAEKVAVSSSMPPGRSGEDRLLDILRALDRAENRPGYEFVSLKWFRDTALTHEGFAWAADERTRHDILREAIDRRLILTNKIANPRPPNFPVTAIRLNRLMPEVNAALGEHNRGLPAFRPVRIRGESLSATVLHDRR